MPHVIDGRGCVGYQPAVRLAGGSQLVRNGKFRGEFQPVAGGADQLRQHVEAKEGNWYNADLVEDVISKLTEIVGTLGFAFVDIRPQVDRDRQGKKINLTFRVQEGPRVFVERIDIGGNVRTIDPVIRREMTLVEGDAFNSSKNIEQHQG